MHAKQYIVPYLAVDGRDLSHFLFDCVGKRDSEMIWDDVIDERPRERVVGNSRPKIRLVKELESSFSIQVQVRCAILTRAT